MIREQGRVTELADGVARVSTDARASCPRCAAGEGCGAGLNAWLLSDRLDLVDCTYSDGPPREGEQVTVEIEEGGLLIAAALAYVLPLLSLVAGAVSAWALGLGDAAQVLGGLLGLLAGALLVRRIMRARGLRDQLRPRVRRSGTT